MQVNISTRVQPDDSPLTPERKRLSKTLQVENQNNDFNFVSNSIKDFQISLNDKKQQSSQLRSPDYSSLLSRKRELDGSNQTLQDKSGNIKKLSKIDTIEVQTEDIVPEALNSQKIFSMGIISPLGYFKKVWNMIMIFVLIYQGTVSPAVAIFDDINKNFIIIELFAHLITFIDIIVNLSTAYENETGFMIVNRTAIACKYMFSWFILDALASIPIDILTHQKQLDIVFMPKIFEQQLSQEEYLLKLIQLFMTIRVLKLSQVADDFFVKIMRLNSRLVKLMKIIIVTALFLHVSACYWLLLGNINQISGWLYNYNLQDANYTHQYVSSLYFILTMFATIGAGNITAQELNEKAFAVIWMMIGVCLYAFIVASMQALFKDLYQRSTKLKKRENFFLDYAKTFGIPQDIIEKIFTLLRNQYFDINQNKLDLYMEDNSIFKDLPTSLFSQIISQVFSDLINKFKLFQDKPNEFLINILPFAKPFVLTKDQEVYSRGDPATEIYFISYGRVVSICQDVVGKLRSQIFVEGCYFGEVDIIQKRARGESVYAETNCVKLWKIDKEKFFGVLEDFPQIKNEFYEASSKRNIVRGYVTKTSQYKNISKALGNNDKLLQSPGLVRRSLFYREKDANNAMLGLQTRKNHKRRTTIKRKTFRIAEGEQQQYIDLKISNRRLTQKYVQKGSADNIIKEEEELQAYITNQCKHNIFKEFKERGFNLPSEYDIDVVLNSEKKFLVLIENLDQIIDLYQSDVNQMNQKANRALNAITTLEDRLKEYFQLDQLADI